RLDRARARCYLTSAATMLPNVAMVNALAAFVAALHVRDGLGYSELRALPSHTQRFVSAGDTDAVSAFARQHRHENAYIGIATRRDASSGTLENCAELSALFVDIDFKSLTEDDARLRLDTFPFTPSLLVHSGGGLHVYWLLKESIVLPGEAATARSLLRRLTHHFSGDLKCAEAARVLRLPDTVNTKYDPPRPVVLEHVDPDCRYNGSEFDDWLPKESRDNRADHRAPFTVPVQIHHGERNDLLY